MVNHDDFLAYLQPILASNNALMKSDTTQALCDEFKLTEFELLDVLLALNNTRAIAPISQFHVSAIALSYLESGFELYFGANLEFSNQALSLVVHAEQSAIHNAWLNGVKKIDVLAINAAPCGFCRQFINEIAHELTPLIYWNRQTIQFDNFLPFAFGPAELDNPKPFMAQTSKICTTLEAHYQLSYAPYSHNRAACEIITYQGECYYGRYIENAAFSPSLSPLSAALNQLQLHRGESGFSDIATVRIMQSKAYQNQRGVSEVILTSLVNAPQCEFIYVN